MNTDPSSSPLAFFAAELKRLRGVVGLTQEQLAGATTYSSATVAAIETCRLIPSRDFPERPETAPCSRGHLALFEDGVEQPPVLRWSRILAEPERKALRIKTYEPY